MSDYLIQTGSNHVFVSTPDLAKKPDMTPYDFEKLGHPEKSVVIPDIPETPVKTETLTPETSPEDIIENLTLEPKDNDEVNDKPGTNAIRSELEAIDDPFEMVDHIFKKYGLKLTRTMKKSTMIERTLDHIGG